jgi:asparagine synthase (glutamine-hydrolysing)
LVQQHGQPFGDPSSTITYLLSRLARKEVTVCLSGDGGDEAFGGYWRIQAGAYAHSYGKALPESVRRNAVPRIAARLGGVGRRLAAMNSLSLEQPGSGYTNSESWYNSLGDVAGPRLRNSLDHDVAACRNGPTLDWKEATIVQRLQYGDYQVQLPDAFLTKVDVASMAASLEVRAPLLDQTVIELGWNLPDDLKLRWGTRKWLLKRIAARRVPAKVIYRSKMGFSPPLATWWRGELGTALDHMMQRSRAAAEGWIDQQAVRNSLREHQAGADHHSRLWSVLWLEIWFRIAVDKEAPSTIDLGVASDRTIKGMIE